MKILIFYSGGKDSQACLIWAVNKYGAQNCEAVFCDTGWENELTLNHIKETTAQLNVKLVIIKSQKYDGMIDLARKKGRFPSVKARFCTEELKSKPAIDYVLSKSENLIIIEGIRKNESISRSKMNESCTYFQYYFQPMVNGKTHTYRKKDILKWCKEFNADKFRPVFNWSAEQVIDYIKESGQLPNPLYYMGFTRVGCFPCIMARHREVKLIIENHPEQWEKIKQYEKEIGSTYLKPGYIPKKFTSNKIYNTAEEIEKYLLSKDVTIDLFETETPSCMSAYNLCE